MFLLTCIVILLFFVIVAMLFAGQNQKKVSFVERLKKAEATGTARVALRDEEEMSKSVVARVFLPLASKYSKAFRTITPAKMIEDCDQAIDEAGLQGTVTGAQITTLSWVLAAGLPLLIGLLLAPHLAKGILSPLQYFGGVLICLILGYRLPIGIIQGKAKKRKHEIQLSLPFTFDLISISVEAGMALDGAMAVVAERTKGPLAEELRRTLREINLGFSRAEALANLAKRTGVDDLKSFVTAVNYISKLGGSLVDVIRIQTEAMRVKRRQRAEKAAAQAPVKIMIPLVLFIFPCLFIVILGPAVLRFAVPSS
ncbi:MAG: type II secretion system F family protein [Candidatus Methylacidiphilales bacterium]